LRFWEADGVLRLELLRVVLTDEVSDSASSDSSGVTDRHRRFLLGALSTTSELSSSASYSDISDSDFFRRPFDAGGFFSVASEVIVESRIVASRTETERSLSSATVDNSGAKSNTRFLLVLKAREDELDEDSGLDVDLLLDLPGDLLEGSSGVGNNLTGVLLLARVVIRFAGSSSVSFLSDFLLYNIYIKH